jgi:Na+/H+ antiporter NhaD/arsenite permease-like protein
VSRQQILTLAIFGACYVYLCVGRKHKAVVVWAVSALLLALGLVSPGAALRSINWNVIGTFVGTSVVAHFFSRSGVSLLLAKILVDRSRTEGMAMLLMCLLGGFVSAWVDNVATVLILAPVAFAMAEHMEVDPGPFIIGLTVSTNLQGSATLIGDAPSMILAAYSGMGFNDFFWFLGRPGLFFAVQTGALASMLVLGRLYQGNRQAPSPFPAVRITSWVPTILLLGIIVALTLLNLFPVAFAYKAGVTCMAAAAAGVVWYYARRIRSGGARGIAAHAASRLRRFPWGTVFLLMGLFVLVSSLSEVGLIGIIAEAIRRVTGGSLFLTFLALVWISVILSGFIDNIPYVTALVPVVLALGKSMGGGPRDAYVLLFGLLIGATVGGNMTPIGASANVVSVAMLEQRGHRVSFGRFMRIGVPFTVVATLAATAFVWVVWAAIR